MNFHPKTIETLYYYDEPLMESYEHEGKKYIGVANDWVGPDNSISLWLYAEVTDEALTDFMANKLTLFDVLANTPALYQGNGPLEGFGTLLQVTWDSIPECRRPDKDAYLRPVTLTQVIGEMSEEDQTYIDEKAKALNEAPVPRP